jgi:glycine/sarcosine N-methyltransferase
MYDTFSKDYDHFVNWPERLAFEIPFIEQQLQKRQKEENGSLRVLDAACGTGKHAIELARLGYSCWGADLSSGMIDQARHNAQQAGVNVSFIGAGFGDMFSVFSEQTEKGNGFDGLLCLGNSLPHVPDLVSLNRVVNDMAACLKAGGLLILQNRNFDGLLAAKERWMEPQFWSADDQQNLFIRFYDFLPDGLIRFNLLTLKRQGQGDWSQKTETTCLYPIRQAELTTALSSAGFENLQFFGSLQGDPFEISSSGNLVVVCRKG